MNTQKEPQISSSPSESKRLLSINEAVVYLGIGRSTAINFLETIGAKRKIGRRTLYDKYVIDEHLNTNMEETNHGTK